MTEPSKTLLINCFPKFSRVIEVGLIILKELINRLFSDEEEKEYAFYRDKKIKNPKETDRRSEKIAPPVPAHPHYVMSDFHRKDEQLSIQLECKSHTLKPLKRRYLRCSSQTTVLILKKLVAIQLFNDSSRCNEVYWFLK